MRTTHRAFGRGGILDQTGDQRPWRRERKRVGPDRERPYRELGSYLSQLRQSSGISQQELAEKSLLTKHPFDRTYIARIENGEAADTAAKFLTYIALLQAKPETVVEIIEVAQRQEGIVEDLPIDEYLSRCKAAEAAGAYNQATMWALAGLSRAAELKDETWRAKLQIAAAIVFKNQQSFSIARRFAEEALNNPLVDEPLRVRAAILVAGVCVQTNQGFSGRGVLHAIDPIELERDPRLRADHTFQSASVEEALGETQRARELFERARVHYSTLSDSTNLARTDNRLAKLLIKLGEVEVAGQFSSGAVRTARAAGHRLLLAAALTTHGRALTLMGNVTEARDSLVEAERMAGQIGDEALLFLARAYLMDLARRMKDRNLVRLMHGHLLSGRKRLRLTDSIRKEVDDMLATPSEEDRS